MNELDFLEQQAVDAAINADWKRAITFNKKIAMLDKNNLGDLMQREILTFFLSKSNLNNHILS